VLLTKAWLVGILKKKFRTMLENQTYHEPRLKLQRLMDSHPVGSDLYEESTHTYLLGLLSDDTTFIPSSVTDKKLLLSFLPVFSTIEEEDRRHRGEKLIWPCHTWWYYSHHFSRTDLYPNLRFGYVVYGEKLMRSSFFVSDLGAVDPLAILQGIQPEAYMGISVSHKSIGRYLNNREFNTNPVELEHMEQLLLA
jgi:hypothetical protein